jgi:hypothetical protein
MLPSLTPDMINALFELVGGILITLSIRKLYRTKSAAGVHWAPVSFFTSWGVWNVFFYPMVGQWYSFYAGITVMSVNFVWLSQIIYYSRREP